MEREIALITGVSREVGRQVTLTLGREGAAVIVNYSGSAARAEEVVKEIGAVGGRAETAQCNASDLESCGKIMADMVFRYGRPDILVNNAGITRDNLLTKILKEDFDAIISTNLKGVFNCTKHTSRQTLRQETERVTNISSIPGVLGNAGQTNHCTVKAGVIGITKSAVRELASRGTTVNAVAPDFITTEVTNVLSDSVKAAATEQTLVKHFGNIQDTAETVAFLASDEAGYITGQVLNVDGGMTMQDAPACVPSYKRTGARLV